MQVDTGASFSLVNERTWNVLDKRLPRDSLQPVQLSLRTWNETPVKLLGQATVSVRFKDIVQVLNVIVAKGTGPNLLGRDWLSPLKITMNINFVANGDLVQMEKVIANHGEVFRDGLGTYKGNPVAIHVKSGANPRFLKARPVPYALRERVEKEIDRLEREGVLRAVSFSEWATPVVPIVKKSGEIRLCGDYRSTVNEATESDTYPMPTANEVFATVAGGKFFTTLDLDRAYTQVIVDDNTSKLLTLNTCKGLYTVHRLAFGVKACPGIFQRLMTSLLAGIPGVAVLIDDIIICGRTMLEMHERLDVVLERIEKAGLRLNKNKCKFAKERVEFLGFVIDSEGIHPAPSKVESIVNTPAPKNKKELQAFLGLYNFYERFIQNKATILEPLHRLLDTEQAWKWTKVEQNAFETAKRLLTFDVTLIHYDVNKPVILTCDSSEYGVGAVLSHEMEDGTDRPVAMASRTLHSHERRYSQLDKEAASIMFGITKFHNYLMARRFRIITDHKPLLGIFDPKKPMPNMLSPRLTRIAIALTSHNYEITYKPGPKIGSADSLSRWPQPVPEQPEQQLCDILLMAETPEDFPYDAEHIASATRQDKTLCQVVHYIQRGWPAKVKDRELRPFWLHRLELSLQNDCILLGCRVVVPRSFRQQVLQVLHKSHTGIVQTKAVARSYVWWPGLNEDVESLIGSCTKCLENRHMPPKTSHEWITPARPWSRL
ncbi:jg821, partial [Pararge aegeria aegeria]